MSPLARAERYLAVRLLALERQLPDDGGNSPVWPEYVATVAALTGVRAQLYPGRGAAPVTGYPPPTRRRA